MTIPSSTSLPLPAPAPRRPRGLVAAAAVLIFAAVLVLLLVRLPRTLVLQLLGQGGVVEKLELGCYAVAAILVLRVPFPDRGSMGWTLVALVVLAFFEVNLGRWLERWIEYPLADPGGPASLNWPGLAALTAVVLAVFGGLLVRTRRPVLSALRRGDSGAWFAAVGMLSLGIAFALDRYHATHFDWNHGYRLTQGIAFASHVAEETLELLASILFGTAAGLSARRGRLPRLS